MCFCMSWCSAALLVFLVAVAIHPCSAQSSVPAQEIPAKIAANEPVYCDGVLVSGDLDLSSLPAAKIPESLILVNCTLPNASFAGAIFAKDAVFWGTAFNSSGGRRHPSLLQAPERADGRG